MHTWNKVIKQITDTDMFCVGYVYANRNFVYSLFENSNEDPTKKFTTFISVIFLAKIHLFGFIVLKSSTESTFG